MILYNSKVKKLYTRSEMILLDKNVKLTLLYDIYGKLLTLKQQSIFEEYYLYNLSLREIAENKSISYQAVRDSIKSSEEALNQFEEKIRMFKIKQEILDLKEFILKNEIGIDSVKDKIINKIDKISEVESDV